MKPEVISLATGSRIVRDDEHIVLFGQPPEVLKGLLQNGIERFDTLVLTDVRERDGSLLNNLEFPFYFFLFVGNGLAEGRRLNLVGTRRDISQALRLLRITLLGPTRAEFDAWETEPELKEEWLRVAEHLALRDDGGQPIPIEGFFNACPFEDDVANVGAISITHLGTDHYAVRNADGSADVDLSGDGAIEPTYHVQSDYVPGGLVKMGIEVLGGASGFTLDEPCTGLALCYNGDYVLIDAVPFLDQNLFARGIAKNQVSAVFLTHLHDDHCAMFPLMLMPHRVEVITTREIYDMAMEKLALSLGWSKDVVLEHFKLVEVRPGKRINYYGMTIEPHVTVHSIPTIGATFSTIHKGYERQICVVGDNNNMSTIREMNREGLVRDETLSNLERIYSQRFNMLIADGGAGAIHGDPADAIQSDADRVVFVHVEELSNEFNTTFSLASSGKRYTVIEGDPSLYTSQVNHYLTMWLGQPFPNRWMRSLLAEEEIRRYNQDDVIIVQDTETRGFVYLILTGYCDVVHHDGSNFTTLASLQAGDIIGEMAVITGAGTRNASVVATSPVTVCVFSEDIFGAFIHTEGFASKLINRWEVRPVLKSLAQFSQMSSTGIEKLGNIARFEDLEPGDTRRFDADSWYILVSGKVDDEGTEPPVGSEFGWRPFSPHHIGTVTCIERCRLVKFRRDQIDPLRLEVPQLNYSIRKYRIDTGHPGVDWILGEVGLTGL
ncbi:MAG: cyclic nucleotide-binding domain-containing protein [Pseudomonadales bacterium]|nr:cyclic nucleotide-binding domain-containing protein [Pseudomonadales bacterium]